MWSGRGVMISTCDNHAEDLEFTPDTLTKCKFFFGKGSKTVGTEMN